MDKIKLIYNPAAGNGQFVNYLEYFNQVFRHNGAKADILMATGPEDIGKYIDETDGSTYKCLIVAGGDGSVNLAVNAILGKGLDIPLGIIPAGTANDFARHLGMPADLKAAVDVLSYMKVKLVDVGKVNDKYFINVLSGGVFTDISHKIDNNQKRTLGKLAYYLQGFKDLSKLKGMKLRISGPGIAITDDFYLFLLTNGSSVGGFSRLAGSAKADDSLLDFIGLRVFAPSQIPAVAAKMLAGTHLGDHRILHFQASNLVIERIDNAVTNLDTDIDGEKGPDYPLHISVLPAHLKILVPSCE